MNDAESPECRVIVIFNDNDIADVWDDDGLFLVFLSFSEIQEILLFEGVSKLGKKFICALEFTFQYVASGFLYQEIWVFCFR